MTDQQLWQAVGVKSLGHRNAILDRIAMLKEHCDKMGNDHSTAAGPVALADTREHPRRPSSASAMVIPPDNHLGPAAGKITVHEQRAKLMFELDRTRGRTAQQEA